ncbi:MAG: N-acetylglucosaminyltransferase, partial [Nitrospinaceae bacterium]|nr:N-acetylglucosaminyltransferase [Nitrospinaceae bacterium]
MKLPKYENMSEYQPKVYDCFPFFNELDLLELRFNELNDFVDKFVLIEATKTHAGKPKPLYFQDNIDRFEKFSDKIISVAIDFANASAHTCGDSRMRENYQRNQIIQVIKNCNPEDVIILSDVDEIPHPEALEKAIKISGVSVLEQSMYYYYMNMVDKEEPLWLWGTRVFRMKDVGQQTLQDIRVGGGTHVSNGGWHFSFLGGAEKVKAKIEAFLHQEYNLGYFTNTKRIERVMAEGKD